MEGDLLSIALQAGADMFTLNRLMFLVIGVLIGLVLGVIPGIGGLVGITMLLPFTYSMDTATALGFMLGLLSVASTSDTIPAVLFGVPGTVGAQATILDGYPMARQGRAPEALGAAFSASLIGGLFGAFVLGVSIPVLRPFMLQMATPELLAVILVGLSLIAVLSGKSPMKGLTMACVGLWLASIGEENQTGALRWTFDSIYLYEGIPLPIVALGIFAVPELATLVMGRVKIAQNYQDTSPFAQLVGVRQTFRNLFLVFRCSTLGSILGAMPGVGSSVLDWITYAHAKTTIKGASETFGTGDVRGVIAPESANNANQGGALVPTIAFGIPGSASMAILLGAFIIQGIDPGPDMLGEHLDITYSMVWTIALANIVGAGICFLAAGYLARLALVPIHLLAPSVLALVFIGAYQATNSWGDILTLCFFGGLGLLLKLMGWPRPPLILGFVLGATAERYMFISTSRYGWEWITRPIVAVLLLIGLFLILQPLFKALMQVLRNRGDDGEARGLMLKPEMPKFDSTLIFITALLALFVWVILSSADWSYYPRIYPVVVASFGLAFLAMHLIGKYLFAQVDAGAGGMDLGNEDVADLSKRDLSRRLLQFISLIAVFVIVGPVFGFLVGLGVFVAIFVKVEGPTTWVRALGFGLAYMVAAYVVFHLGLRLYWPDSLIGQYLPGLQRIRLTDIF